MGELDGQIAYVRSLLSVDRGDPAIAALDALTRRKKIFEAVRMMSLRGARLRPLALVFEDLHWIDSSSEEYIGSVMDSLAAMPIILVLTHRIGYTPPFGTRSFRATLISSRCRRPRLRPWPAACSGRRPCHANSWPRSWTAEGVPLFVEEVTKALLDLGVLRRENGGYHMVKGIAEMSVPDTMQGTSWRGSTGWARTASARCSSLPSSAANSWSVSSTGLPMSGARWRVSSAS
jgi:hypothetical protein